MSDPALRLPSCPSHVDPQHRIDMSRSEVYCLCTTLEGSTYHHRLHVIDIRSGAKRGNSGVAVAGASLSSHLWRSLTLILTLPLFITNTGPDTTFTRTLSRNPSLNPKQNPAPTFQLILYPYHALTDLTSACGAGSVPGNAVPQDPSNKNHVIFQSFYHLQRPALLLAQGQVWCGFGSGSGLGVGNSVVPEQEPALPLLTSVTESNPA